ncbi:MAG: adhesin [Catenulispora sp.]
MLTLTDRAAAAIHTMTERSELPADSAGLRIVAHGAPGAEGQSQLSAALSPAPQGDDQVVESGDARVFLEPEAARALDNQQLDASVEADGSVQLLVAPQS